MALQKDKLVNPIAIFLMMFHAISINSQQNSHAYLKILSVNQNWERVDNHETVQKDVNNEKELVQLHLLNVVDFLEDQKTDHLNKEQKLNRLRHIETLKIYTKRGIYPINEYKKERVPIFIDEYDTFCAVGYLMKKSGFEKMAREIAKNQLLEYLENIHHEQLKSWQEESGLSLFELALIQPTYGPPIPVCATSSPIEWKQVSQKNGLKQLFQFNEELYGIRQVNDLGLENEVVVFDFVSNNWTRVGNIINGPIEDLALVKDRIYASVFIPADEQPHQILLLESGVWKKEVSFNKQIIEMESFAGQLIVTGDFTQANTQVVSKLIAINESGVTNYTPKGQLIRSFDHMIASETALFLLSNGGIFRCKNDSIERLASIQYYQYVKNITIDALADTLFVTSLELGGCNAYYDQLQHQSYFNNMLHGQVSLYGPPNFTRVKKLNGHFLISGDFRCSTLQPMINDERYLTDCPEEQCSEWYGAGLMYEYKQVYYPVLSEGVILDFIQIEDLLITLSNEGNIMSASLSAINNKVKSVKKMP